MRTRRTRRTRRARTARGIDANGSTAGEQTPAHRREHVLAVVESSESPLSLSALVDALVERADPSSSRFTRENLDPERVRVRLHHVDLPKLQAAGALEYDRSNHVVSSSAERAVE